MTIAIWIRKKNHKIKMNRNIKHEKYDNWNEYSLMLFINMG